MIKLLLAVLVAVAAVVTPAPAQTGPRGPGLMDGGPPFGPPPFLSHVFPPKLVMENQGAIGLRPAQADAIKQAIGGTQQRLVDLQWRLEAESEALAALLEKDRVDEAAVLRKLEEVLGIEQQVKKENFGLLVRIKNELDPEQQVKLRALRPERRGGRGGGAGPPPM